MALLKRINNFLSVIPSKRLRVKVEGFPFCSFGDGLLQVELEQIMKIVVAYGSPLGT